MVYVTFAWPNTCKQKRYSKLLQLRYAETTLTVLTRMQIFNMVAGRAFRSVCVARRSLCLSSFLNPDTNRFSPPLSLSLDGQTSITPGANFGPGEGVSLSSRCFNTPPHSRVAPTWLNSPRGDLRLHEFRDIWIWRPLSTTISATTICITEP